VGFLKDAVPLLAGWSVLMFSALLQQLRTRRTEKAHPTAAVAVSPYGRRDDFAAAKAAGFDYYTSKPIDTNAFIAALVALAR
jgi:CheY-like chemotaxis protein